MTQALAPDDIALWRALQPLRSVACWMQLGAHPDDEWNGFLAWLALGRGARTVFACALRGEGGQNAVGGAQGHALGVLRSREMTLAAGEIGLALRWLNRGEDDSLVDFGFSRDAEDTLRRWGHDRLVAGLVEAIRAERPDVVLPSFLDVPGQHGHHRAVTRCGWEAVALAADPAYAGSALPPWRVAKTYLPAFSGAGASYDDREPPPPATIGVELGEDCAALGLSWAALGERSRRHHASQGMGLREVGGRVTLALHQCRGPADRDSVMDHLPVWLADLADAPPAWAAADAATRAALAAFPNRAAVADALHAALGCLEAETADHRVQLRRRQLSRAAGVALGRLPAWAGGPWRAGERVALPVAAGRMVVPAGWTATPAGDGWRLDIPAGALPFGSNRAGFDPLGGSEPVHAVVAWTHGGVGAEAAVDPVRPVLLAPACDVVAAPSSLAVAPGGRAVLLLSGAEPPADWPVLERLPAPGGLRLILAGDAVLRLAGAGSRLEIIGDAATGVLGRVAAAEVRIRPIDVAVDDGARVAVAAGAAEGLAGRLRQVGIDAREVDGLDALRGGGFTCLLVGHLGFARHPWLATGAAALLDWVRDGGTLLTFYHRPQDGFPPALGLRFGVPSFRWRATLPDAPVRVLAPGHRLLTWPNRIGPRDWDGWVRERGLYFAAEWCADHLPLLETADPGEPAMAGGLLVAPLGRGRHVHTALALHHQLPALVPGAWRLLANLAARAG